MNSKILFLILFLFAGCGVKAPPLKHPDTVVESYVKGYTNEILPQVSDEKAKTLPMPAAPKN